MVASKPIFPWVTAALMAAALLSVHSPPTLAQREPPPSTLRPDSQQKSAQERQAREQRQKAVKNTVDCFISERRLNPNKHTTCIYKCPSGKLESENVAPGYQCPPKMNVINR